MRFDLAQDGDGATVGFVGDGGLSERGEDGFADRLSRQAWVDDVRDGAVQLMTARGQPDGLQVTLDEVLIGQINQRRLDDTVNHARGIAEEILVVGLRAAQYVTISAA